MGNEHIIGALCVNSRDHLMRDFREELELPQLVQARTTPDLLDLQPQLLPVRKSIDQLGRLRNLPI